MNFLRYLIHQYRSFRYAAYRKRYQTEAELQRIRNSPRYLSGQTELLGLPAKFIDGQSFFFTYKEIFVEKIYDFSSSDTTPYIIDAGANIGLSVIRFKQLYPKALVTAFEPDKIVFNTLTENVKTFSLKDVTLINKAVWYEETTLRFLQEGADAGRIVNIADSGKFVDVEAVNLRPFLEGPKIDFLKVDIEGAEFNVLKNCGDLLHNVDRLFVEYHSFVQKEQRLNELLDILKSAGFRIHINAPGLRSKSPFLHIETYMGMDMQLNIYAFRD